MGCSQNESPEKKPAQSEEKKEPAALKKMLSSMDAVNEELDKKIKMEQEAQEKEQEASSQAAEQGDAGKKTEENSSDKMPDLKKEETHIKDIHAAWNTLEPEVIKAGLSTADSVAFETALDALTMYVSDKKMDEARLSAAAIYKPYAELSRVFSGPVPADYYLVKYEVMTTAIMAEQEEWDKARERLPLLEEDWKRLKTEANEVDQKLITQTDYAVTDMKNEIENEQTESAMIKSEIVMKHLKNIEGKLRSKV